MKNKLSGLSWLAFLTIWNQDFKSQGLFSKLWGILVGDNSLAFSGNIWMVL